MEAVWESPHLNPAEFAFAPDLTVGVEPDTVPPPVAGDYTHADVYTQRDATGILETVSPQVLSETDLGGGLSQLRVSTLVRNTGQAPWPAVQVELAELVPGEPDIPVVSLPEEFSLDPNETLATAVEATLHVATPDVPVLRAAILDGSRFRLSGRQQAVFAYPVQLLRETFESGPPSSPHTALTGPSFAYVPMVGSGTLWLEWEPFYREPLVTVITPKQPNQTATIARMQGPDRLLPALVKDVTRAGTTFIVSFFDPEDLESGQGRSPAPLPLVMKEGLVVTEPTFEEHPEALGVTEIPEMHTTGNDLALTGFFPPPVPFHFNNIAIRPGIEVSGSFGFRPEELAVTLEMKDFAIELFEVHARYRADCNLLLETEEGADNSADTIAGREATLLDLPLLNVSLPAGFSFEPHLVLTAGALVIAPTSVSIPLTAGLDIEMAAGVRQGQPYYESDFTPVPLHVSDPGLYEALGATAEVYLDSEIKAFIGGLSGGILTGPTLGARAAAEFTLAPLDDPWWSVNAELTAFAGMELNLAGLVSIVDAEHDLRSWPLAPFFPLEADGLLVPGLKASSFDPQPGFAPLGDPRTRWIRSLQPDANGLLGGHCFAIALEGTDDLLAGSGSLSDGLIARFSPEGELRWAMNPTAQMLAAHAVAEPDGGFVVLSAGQNSVRLAKFDGNGTVVWNRQVSPASGTVWLKTIDFVRRDGSGGTAEYLVLGQVSGSSLPGFHASLMKLDATGNPVWSKVYPVPPFSDESTTGLPGALCLTGGGDIIVAGNAAANLSDDPIDIPNITVNGLVFKVNGDSGDVIWSAVPGMRNGMSYDAVSEGPDGAISTGGNALPNVTSDSPSMLLTKLDTDGQLIDSVLIGSGGGKETVPHGGETPYDTIRDMAWVDGRLWVCGQIGLYNAGGVGGVGAGASAFTAMISEDLDVSRFVIHAGPATDSFHAIKPTANGLFVAGYSTSFHPWRTGAAAEGEGNPGSLLAMVLPWEGRTRFHLASAGRQPDDSTLTPSQGNFFVTPRVRAASQFTADSHQSLFGGLRGENLTDDRTRALTILAEAYTVSPSDYPLTPVFIEPAEYKSLEFMPRSLITDFSSHLNWHQIDATSDSDGDGLDAEAESFLGTDSGLLDEGVVRFDYLAGPTPEESIVRFTLPRARLAAPRVPQVQSGADPATLDLREDVNVIAEPLDAEREELKLEQPASDPFHFLHVTLPDLDAPAPGLR